MTPTSRRTRVLVRALLAVAVLGGAVTAHATEEITITSAYARAKRVLGYASFEGVMSLTDVIDVSHGLTVTMADGSGALAVAHEFTPAQCRIGRERITCFERFDSNRFRRVRLRPLQSRGGPLEGYAVSVWLAAVDVGHPLAGPLTVGLTAGSLDAEGTSFDCTPVGRRRLSCAAP